MDIVMTKTAKTAMERADGFPRGIHRVRAQNLVGYAHDEATLQAVREVEILLEMNPGDPRTVLEAWVKVTRETAQEKKEEE
jgi:hypothetical protein